MKKILSLLLIAAMGISFVGCNGKGDAAGSGSKVDSLTSEFGSFLGNMIKYQSKADSNFNQKDFLKGFKEVMKGDTSSYYLQGMGMAMQVMNQVSSLRQEGVDIDANKVLKFFEKALVSKDSVSDMQLQTMMGNFQRLAQEAVSEAKEKSPEAIKNKKAGKEYQDKMAKQPGYKKTASGLVYKVITEGKGENFTDQDVVMVKYVGKHIDGSEFDSSKGEAVPFPLTQVVKGFAEMLKLMKPGGKVEAIIPGELAYGVNGNQGIGPNETLIFEMEAVGKKDNSKPAQGPQAIPVPAK